MNLNFYASILTHCAPTSNYRGESEANRSVLQKLTAPDGQRYVVVSADSIRNALREMLAARGLPMRRTRIHDGEQLSVHFSDQPNPDKYADDFIFGYMVAEKRAVAKKAEAEPEQIEGEEPAPKKKAKAPATKGEIEKKVTNGHPAKRVSILRMNFAVATSPYADDATLHQSPKQEGAIETASSSLLHREVSWTSFQYCFAVDLTAAKTNTQIEWLVALLECIAELAGVSGCHARSYFDFAPRAMVARLTPRPAPGFPLYAWDEDGRWSGRAAADSTFYATGVDVPNAEQCSDPLSIIRHVVAQWFISRAV